MRKMVTDFTSPASTAFRHQSLTSSLQRRGLASHQDVAYSQVPYDKGERVGDKRFSQFDMEGKVFVVTGAASSPHTTEHHALPLPEANRLLSGGRGLGLCMAEGLVEAGGKVHCLDRAAEPPKAFAEAEARLKGRSGGGLKYHQVDVTQNDVVEKCMADIAAESQRLDGLIVAAAIQQCSTALDFKKEDIMEMMDINYTGVFLSARACARQMMKYKIQGSICLVASMSGTIANRGFMAPIYNSSKAAVVQLARNLAMEWGRMNPDGSGGIRVNSLSPGHIVTPMVEENFKRGEADRAEWENNSMLGRLSTPEEYKAAGLFMLSKASSYMTAHDMKMDGGGTTAW